LAALLVFFFHYAYFNPGIRLDLALPWIGKLLQFPFGFGATGVDIFFVLSGFLLALPFARSTLTGAPAVSLPRYFQRRVLRVFPAYYAQLGVLLLGGAWFLSWRSLSAGELVAHLAMFFNIGPEPVRAMVRIWWTLPIEFSFYLLLPFLASYLKPARGLALFALSCAVSIVFRLWCADHFAATPARVFGFANQLPGSLPEFLWGALAAIVVQWMAFNRRPRPRPLVLDAMLVSAATLVCFWFWQVLLPHADHYWRGHWSMLVAPIVLGALYAVMVISLYWGSRIGRLLCANRAVHFLGLISYSFYLWHFVVLQQAPLLLGNFFAGLHGALRFGFSLLLVVAVASTSYFLIERPVLHWVRKRRTAS